MKARVLGALLLLVALPAVADIIEWRDENGVRHFTNVRGEVPGEYQDSAQVVVDEVARRRAMLEADDPVRESVRALAGRRSARRAARQADVARAYQDGVADGFDRSATAYATGGMGGGGGGGGVVVNGPLAVAVGGGSDGYGPDGGMAPFGGGFWGFDPYFYPLVTTSFDQGRSRHLTLRMLMQDQFAIDRAGPYMYVERLIPPFGYVPLGPRLSPVLGRGLPNSVPFNAQVITR